MVDSYEVNSEHWMKALVTFVAVSKATSTKRYVHTFGTYTDASMICMLIGELSDQRRLVKVVVQYLPSTGPGYL